MAAAATSSILWIGSAELPEFAGARLALNQLARVVECRTFAQALQLDPMDDCALVVVAESLPREHAAADYAAMRRLRPTVPLVRVYGSLCEGEMRTNPPPQAWRIAWLSAAAALTAEWRRLERGKCPSWGRPAAATDEERLLNDVPPEPLPPLPLKSVGLWVREPATAAWLSDFLQRRGVQVVRVGREIASESPAVEAIIWDRPSSLTLQESELAELRRTYSRTPLVVLANFPRVDEVRQLCECGVVAVLAKPLLPDELEIALRSVVEVLVS